MLNEFYIIGRLMLCFCCYVLVPIYVLFARYFRLGCMKSYSHIASTHFIEFIISPGLTSSILNNKGAYTTEND